jgi:hypothetical protein
MHVRGVLRAGAPGTCPQAHKISLDKAAETLSSRPDYREGGSAGRRWLSSNRGGVVQVMATVDASLRKRSKCNHTATHLLQAALKQVLPNDVAQQGSAVNFNSLRFDFNLDRPMKVNQASLSARPRMTASCPGTPRLCDLRHHALAICGTPRLCDLRHHALASADTMGRTRKG